MINGSPLAARGAVSPDVDHGGLLHTVVVRGGERGPLQREPSLVIDDVAKPVAVIAGQEVPTGQAGSGINPVLLAVEVGQQNGM